MKTTETEIVKVEVELRPGGNFCLSPVWSNVDRPVVGGISVPARYKNRVLIAMLGGAAYGPAVVATDVNGKTYANADCKIFGRHLNRDLKAIGY